MCGMICRYHVCVCCELSAVDKVILMAAGVALLQMFSLTGFQKILPQEVKETCFDDTWFSLKPFHFHPDVLYHLKPFKHRPSDMLFTL